MLSFLRELGCIAGSDAFQRLVTVAYAGTCSLLDILINESLLTLIALQESLLLLSLLIMIIIGHRISVIQTKWSRFLAKTGQIDCSILVVGLLALGSRIISIAFKLATLLFLLMFVDFVDRSGMVPE